MGALATAMPDTLPTPTATTATATPLPTPTAGTPATPPPTLMVATGPTPATPTASAPPTAPATPTPGNSFSSPSYVRGHHLRACCNGGEWGIQPWATTSRRIAAKARRL